METENNEVGLTLRIPENLKNEIAQIAKEEKRSLNKQIAHVLEIYLQTNSETKESLALQA